MSLLQKDLEGMLGTKEKFESAQRLRDLENGSDRKEFEELRDEDIKRDNLPEVEEDDEETLGSMDRF